MAGSESREERFFGAQQEADRVFAELIKYRVREALLVSSPYDSYILQAEGLLGESLDIEYQQLNLSSAPRITQATTGEEALELLDRQQFDLVVSMVRLGEMDVRQFGSTLKARHPELPIVVLALSPVEAARMKDSCDPTVIDQIFIWRGDVQILLAICKYVEDLRNVQRDTELAGVRTILLVENSVRFYSSYLPMLYTEIMKQNQALMADGVNDIQRLRRMKARPKILLAETFEEGWEIFEKYRRYLLGVISDARFPRGGRIDPVAGIDFVRRIMEEDADMPALIQSSDESLAVEAAAIGATFLNKRSPRLLDELGRFIRTSLGFGDFIFCLPDGKKSRRVRDLAAMPSALRRVPDASLRYHASRNHFSNWCMARTEFALAEQLRPIKVTEFETIKELRQYLIDAFSRLRSDVERGVVADFSRQEFDDTFGFVRIGGGSIGGKGRGLGFINAYLAQTDFPTSFHDAEIYIPPSAVIGTDTFDEFLLSNDLSDLALSDATDQEINAAFLDGKLPRGIRKDLKVLVDRVHYPLAVRSSSLLEDSHDRPFAGIYETLMLSNNDPDLDARLGQLCKAIKLVYASTFHQNAKAYLQQGQFRMEEEKMAVVVQKLVGHDHGGYFYPAIAGVARSYNFYPVLEMTPEGGVASIALGLGKTVVDGERAVRFSPECPRNLPQFSSTEETLENAQREFYALDLKVKDPVPMDGAKGGLVRLDLEMAEQHGSLRLIGSTYSRDNDAIYDGISRQGTRLVTFAGVLKTEIFPLSEILKSLLLLGCEAMSCPVEIEFAVTLAHTPGDRAKFAFLQIRPMTVESGSADLEEVLGSVDRETIVCESSQALGQGQIRGIRDIVYVKPDDFDRGQTHAIASELGAINAEIVREGGGYLLIGPGRWGTSDPWLGIPVAWYQIAGAKAIIETDLAEVPVTPSEGTHFFQNITSFGIGYLQVNRRQGGGFVDYDWLESLPAVRDESYLRHVRLSEPLGIWVDGRSRQGLILRHDPFA